MYSGTYIRFSAALPPQRRLRAALDRVEDTVVTIRHLRPGVQ